MPITPYPAIDDLLDSLRTHIHQLLGEKLVGLYLYGSLVSGEFDQARSDLDLLAVLAGDLMEAEFAGLEAMHHAFAAAQPAWDDRIEIAYLTQQALQNFRTQRSPIAVISPGEPFHWKEAGKDWLINWWVVRKQGVALYGPPPQSVIDPISDAEFLTAVRKQAGEWRSYIHEMTRRNSQGYAIQTLCRALYAYTNGEQVGKRQASLWAAERLPQWAPLIHSALRWRDAPSDEGVDHAATFAETVRFVEFVSDLINTPPTSDELLSKKLSGLL